MKSKTLLNKVFTFFYVCEREICYLERFVIL